MAECRPFAMLEHLYAAAEDIWFSLSTADHLEAFAAHPQIGSKRRAPSQKKQAADWSAGEQSGVSNAAENVREQLADANRLYKNKFGFIFIVYASGKTVDEMLAICRARIGNSVETELKIAAQEQHKITETRLNKLLEK